MRKISQTSKPLVGEGRRARPDGLAPISRPVALNELAHDRIRSDIVSGVFAFGERLSEEQLSQLYGLSRAPVRTALLRLQAEELIQIVPQRGAFVFKPTAAEVRALCELRAALETGAARLAMTRNASGLAEDLSAIIDDMRPFADAVGAKPYQELDSRFHAALLQAADSPMLVKTYEHAVRWRFAALRKRLANDRQHALRSFAEHVRIQDLVAAGDLAALIEALETHIENTNVYFARMLDVFA